MCASRIDPEKLRAALERLKGQYTQDPSTERSGSEGPISEQRIHDCGIPEGIGRVLEGQDFDHGRHTVRAALKFSEFEDPRRVFVLGGGCGTGKSVAAAYAAALARTPCKHVVCLDSDGREFKAEIPGRPMYCGWTTGLEIIQAGSFDAAFWARARKPDFLVVDDLGAEPLDAKGFGESNLTGLVVYRESAGKKTLITTNATPETFKKHYCSGAGQRIWDRIDSATGWYDCSGGSQRK